MKFLLSWSRQATVFPGRGKHKYSFWRWQSDSVRVQAWHSDLRPGRRQARQASRRQSTQTKLWNPAALSLRRQMHKWCRTEFSSPYPYPCCRKFNTTCFVLQREDILLPCPHSPQEGKHLGDVYKELSVNVSLRTTTPYNLFS